MYLHFYTVYTDLTNKAWTGEPGVVKFETDYGLTPLSTNKYDMRITIGLITVNNNVR